MQLLMLLIMDIAATWDSLYNSRSDTKVFINSNMGWYGAILGPNSMRSFTFDNTAENT